MKTLNVEMVRQPPGRKFLLQSGYSGNSIILKLYTNLEKLLKYEKSLFGGFVFALY